MATPTSKAPARETIPRTTANPYPAPYNTHDPEWIKHYPDSLDQHHAHTNGGESEGFAYSNGEISSAPPPEMSPLEKSDLKADKRCVFCQIVAGKRPCYEVYRDQHCMAFLDLFPLTEGHTLIIPLAHHPRLTSIPVGLSQHLGGVVSLVSRAVVSAVHATDADSLDTGFNLLVNNGKVAGQVVFHTHFHVIPRNSTDAGRFRSGNLNRLKLTGEEARNMQKKIKAKIAEELQKEGKAKL